MGKKEKVMKALAEELQRRDTAQAARGGCVKRLTNKPAKKDAIPVQALRPKA